MTEAQIGNSSDPPILLWSLIQKNCLASVSAQKETISWTPSAARCLFSLPRLLPLGGFLIASCCREDFFLNTPKAE